MTGEMSAFDKARALGRDRTARARDLQASGLKVIGVPCAYVPSEMLTALDLVPYRLYGHGTSPITEADRALPASFCSLMRNCLDCVLKGETQFLDGVAVVHSCDPQEKTARFWEAYSKYGYFHFIDMPVRGGTDSLPYFKGQLLDFQKTLEAFAGRPLTRERLLSAIDLHDRQRALVRELYELTKPAPPLVTASEIVSITRAIMSMPVGEANALLEEVLRDGRARKPAVKPGRTRLALWTSTLEDPELLGTIEAQADVVVDDNCAGLRPFRGSIERTADPLDGLAAYYLGTITCARTFVQTGALGAKKDRATDLSTRFGFFLEQSREWKVDGALLLLVRYCDPFAYEMMDLKDYLESHGIPASYVEYDSTSGAMASIKTRVDAFVEMLQQGGS